MTNRLQLARELAQKAKATSTTDSSASGKGKAVEKSPERVALEKAKMPHPYKAGKMVSCQYFGEIFPPLGLTLKDYLEVSYRSRKEHEQVLAEIEQLKANK